MKLFLTRPAALVAVLAVCQAAVAGPPLQTEDPEILDQWQWEIITATTLTSTDGGDTWQAPFLDLSLGLIQDSVQVFAAYPYVYVDPDDGDSEWDFGNLETGIKWRFINTERLQVAAGFLYAFGVTRRTAEKGIGDDEDVAVFLLPAQYQLNDKWRINASAGYASVDDGRDEWFYSGAVAYGLNDRWELLFELAGATDNDFEDDLLDVRAGFDFAFTEDFHFLFSAATGLREPDGEDELDYDIFMGLQFFR
ncbi:MAG: hypothetical protein JSV45_09645 [Chromatiales bacterium]|nr:MAG: hypothetical protein JSV45_09645 [Chromatiales bacterium]